MFIATVIQNFTYIVIFVLVVGFSTIKQLYREHISGIPIESGNSYAYYKSKMAFLDEDGNKIYGVFSPDHSILDHIKLAVFDFNKNFPNIINKTFDTGFGRQVFGFYDNNVTFTLYTKDLKNETVLYKIDDLPKQFDKTRKNVFCVHGWLNSGRSPACQRIKNQLVLQDNINVFIVDWSTIANIATYPIPAAAIRVISEFYAEFINDLVEKVGVKLHDIHLIGHSLGAHLSGFTGRKIRRGKVARITGLDPALPSFTIVPTDHLNVNDSHFVDVIHTCGGFLGVKEPIGHVDFYPNGGGPPQPGCEDDWQTVESCSHAKSHELFAESIAHEDGFMAITITAKNVCDTIPMGYYTPHRARGVYFLLTA